MLAESTGSSCPASLATAANTSSGATPRAASVATRRNAACSSASRVRAARLSAFAIAVAKSSVKEARRDSLSADNGCSVDREPTIMTPQGRPWTMIGDPAT
jgi:hypothetical protein